MLTLPDKFEALNNAGKSTPTVLVGVSSDVIENEQTTFGDWSNNSAETQVNYTDSPGNVVIASDTIPTQSQLVHNGIAILIVGRTGTALNNRAGAQEFKQTTGAGSKYVDIVTLRAVVFESNPLSGSYTVPKLYAYIAKGTNPGTAQVVSPVLVKNLNPTTYLYPNFTNVTYDFSSYNVEIDNNETYFIIMYGDPGSGYTDQTVAVADNVSGAYANGNAWQKASGSWNDLPAFDLYFSITFFGNYYLTSGSITTQIIDLGEVPTVDGEILIEDLQGDQTIDYTLYGSTDNFGASDVTIGTITDGYVLTGSEIYRYYKVKADFSTADKNETPILQSIKITFISYYKFSDTDALGYDPSLKKISSLTTEISDTGLPTIGQVSLTFGRTEVLSNFIYSAYPKNRRIYIKLGFVDTSFTETDYIDFYNGVIDDYDFKDQDVLIKVKDPNQNWKTTVPKNTSAAGKQSSGTFASITATADHPVDVMLDILQNYLEFRDSLIDFGSFEIVKAAIPDYEVTRTISGSERTSGQTLLNELRFLIGAYFIPDPSGKIKLKLYDRDEAVSGDITINDYLKEPSWEGNATSIINQTYIEFAWNTGTEVYDYVYVGIDATSQTNYNEQFEFQYEDKWTVSDAQGDSQMLDLTNRILNRYADPPPKFKCRLDRRRFIYEVADMLTVTTTQAPSSDLSGVVEEKYQIIQKNFNPLSNYVDYTLMKVVPSS